MIVTNENFSVLNKDSGFYDLEFIEKFDEITIKNSHFVCPQFYYKRTEKGFILTTNFKEIDSSVDLKFRHTNWILNGKVIKMLNAPQPPLPFRVINNYSEIKINRNGELKVKENNYDKLFSVPIEDSLELIKQWKEKYADITSDLVKEGKFIPTISGGMDTRVLSYFWRKYNFDEYYCMSSKNCGKIDESERGKIEVAIGEKVISKIYNRKLNRRESRGGKYTLNGKYTDFNVDTKYFNNKGFIIDCVNRCKDYKDYKYIMPFCDDLYLQIKPNERHELRILFLLLFANDLLDIEFISVYNRGSYGIQKYSDIILRCKEMIKKWNIGTL